MKTPVIISMLALCAAAHAQWPTFHGNNQRTGTTSTALPATLPVKWAYDCKGQILGSPVVSPNGEIFFGPVWQDDNKPKQFFYCLNPDGTLKWRFETKWIDDQVNGCPAFDSQGRVYFGTADGKLYCLNSDGTEAWSVQGNNPTSCYVLTTADGVYAMMDGNMRAFDFNGVQRWALPAHAFNSGGATETLQGNIVWYRNGGVMCADPVGNLLWSANADWNLGCPVVTPAGDIVASGYATYWLDPLTGAQKYFSSTFLDRTWGSPVVDAQGNTYVIVGYKATKFSPTGGFLGQELLQDPDSNSLGHCEAAPVMDGTGRIFFGLGFGMRSTISYERNIEVRNSSLTRIGLFPLPHSTGFSSPAIAPSGTMYIGCYDGKFYALGQ